MLVFCGASGRDPIESIDPQFHGLLAAEQLEVLSLEDISAAEPGTIVLDGILTLAHAPVTAALVDSVDSSQLKIISNYGSGVDHIDLAAMKERGIPVANLRALPELTEATADCAFALLLAAARRVVECDAYARSAAFTSYDNLLLLGSRVSGTTLGIVGMGTIGLEVARRAAGFRMRILYHNRNRCGEELEGAVQATFCPTLPELLAESDYVVLMLSGNELLMDAAACAAMKPGATLINMARGGVVDNKALAVALGSGHIGSAALDVTDPEPLPLDHPLRGQPRCTILPHRGSAARYARDAMCRKTFGHLMLGLRGDAKSIASIVDWV